MASHELPPLSVYTEPIIFCIMKKAERLSPQADSSERLSPQADSPGREVWLAGWGWGRRVGVVVRCWLVFCGCGFVFLTLHARGVSGPVRACVLSEVEILGWVFGAAFAFSPPP
jgi:hypothetical protein